jgi:sec-independent protein translocase protein TatB
MFDVGFSELIVIAVVALIVIGPERLPKVARTAGHLLGRLQRYVNDVKSDINREMQLDELKKLQGQIQDSARSFENSIQQGLSSTEKGLNEAIQPPAPTVDPAADVAPDTATAAVPADAVAEVSTAAPVTTPPAAPEVVTSLADAVVSSPAPVEAPKS